MYITSCLYVVFGFADDERVCVAVLVQVFEGGSDLELVFVFVAVFVEDFVGCSSTAGANRARIDDTASWQ